MLSRLSGRKLLFGVALLLLANLLLVACGDTPPTAQPTPITTPGGATGGPTTVNVDMDGFKYLPAEITITAGSTVVWANKEAPKHTVTEDAESFDSGSMSKDATFTRKFDTPGTVGYFCKFHGSAGQGMAGKVIVVAASDDPAPTTAAEATQEPTQEAPPTPTDAAQIAPTATDEPAPPPPTPTSAPQSAGSVRFRDNIARSDQAVISVSNLPQRPTGKAIYAWLTGAGVGAINLGRVTPDASGNLELKHDAPNGANLLATYNGFQVTLEELEVNPTAPGAEVVASGQLPPQALVHIRHLLVAFEAAPNATGLEVGLLGQVEEVRRHAEFLRDSQTKQDWTGVRLHAEHLVNIIEGSKGANFGDLNKDGKVTNPGDGYGLLQGGDQLGYLQGSKDHAELAAIATDATADIKLHAGHVGITVDNVSGWVTTIRDKSLEVLKAGGTSETEKLVQEILALANQTFNGVDLKGDGQILPIPGSGGAITSYQHAQLMAVIPLLPGGQVITPGGPAEPTVAPPPTVAPANTPTQGAAPPPGGNELKIEISQFKFGTAPAKVKAGTKVTWTNLDSAPHTATADNNSFDSNTLQKGQSFSFTFTQPGTLNYYCALHGGPGGQGMSSTLTVEP